jgi:hypothetical protein
MLARLLGSKAVPQQGAEGGAASARANPLAEALAKDWGRSGSSAIAPGGARAAASTRAKSFLLAGVIGPWILQRRALDSRPQSARLRPSGPRPGPASAAVLTGVLMGSALMVALVSPLRAEPAPRPPDLKILEEKTTMQEGTHWLGVYGRVAEPDQPGFWRMKLWREWSDRVEITTESIDCRPGHATRAGVSGGKVVVQTLNPGGPINPANRLDHLIWWATCFPEQAGRDPAGLGPLARSLGFDGRQREHFEVLSVPPLPHP